MNDEYDDDFDFSNIKENSTTIKNNNNLNDNGEKKKRKLVIVEDEEEYQEQKEKEHQQHLGKESKKLKTYDRNLTHDDNEDGKEDWVTSNQVNGWIDKLNCYLGESHASGRQLIADWEFYPFLKMHRDELDQNWWNNHVFSRHKLFTNALQAIASSWAFLDRILIPVNLCKDSNPDGEHWILIFILPRNRWFLIADSRSNNLTTEHKEMLGPVFRMLDMYSRYNTTTNWFFADIIQPPRQAHELSKMKWADSGWHVQMIWFKNLQTRGQIDCGIRMLALLATCAVSQSEYYPNQIELSMVHKLRSYVERFIPKEIYGKGKDVLKMKNLLKDSDIPLTETAISRLFQCIAFELVCIYDK